MHPFPRPTRQIPTPEPIVLLDRRGRAVAVEVVRAQAAGPGALPAWGCRWTVTYLGQAVALSGWTLSLESAHRTVDALVDTNNRVELGVYAEALR